MKFKISLLLLIFFCSNLFADRSEPYTARLGLINPGGYTIVFNSQGPLSYNLPTPNELPKDAVDAGNVFCKSCQHGLSIPIPIVGFSSRGTHISGAQGNGSFWKALENLRKERPEIRGIYDVKVDFHMVRILGIYKRLCTEVSARGYK